jgi:circadian clock protein KaiC
MTDDHRLHKRATGIRGLDTATAGGLPRAGATLVLGTAGSGKTVLGLQILAMAAERGEGGLLLSFEESSAQMQRDAASFVWGEALIKSAHTEFIDARTPAGTRANGSFDLSGLTAVLAHRSEALQAHWIVLDGIDRLLCLQPDVREAVEQISALGDWCEARDISLILTGKVNSSNFMQPAYIEGIEFMLSTVLVLSTEVHKGRLNRRFRIAKYRGTGHITDEIALVMNDHGVHLPYDGHRNKEPEAASTERLSTGIQRLDSLLGGGLYRGSTALISGQPGTAKTTLAASIANAAAARGERALLVSFDELPDRITRNLASVGMDLAPHVQSGLLQMVNRDAWRALIEEHYIAIGELIASYQPKVLVIDPISALFKANSMEEASNTIERLIDNARAQGITCILTSLNETDQPSIEATRSQASTLADTWLTLDYSVYAGERNRSLSIVKSRGTAHSNQVRELLLNAEGISLANVYQYGSEVLMGTARLQKESEEQLRERRLAETQQQRQRELQQQLHEAEHQAERAQAEAQRLRQAIELERTEEQSAASLVREHQQEILRQRGTREERATMAGEQS